MPALDTIFLLWMDEHKRVEKIFSIMIDNAILLMHINRIYK